MNLISPGGRDRPLGNGLKQGLCRGRSRVRRPGSKGLPSLDFRGRWGIRSKQFLGFSHPLGVRGPCNGPTVPTVSDVIPVQPVPWGRGRRWGQGSAGDGAGRHRPKAPMAAIIEGFSGDLPQSFREVWAAPGEGGWGHLLDAAGGHKVGAIGPVDLALWPWARYPEGQRAIAVRETSALTL